MWIHREISNKLREIVRSFPAVVITGARQVGKTSLITHLFPQWKALSLDHPSLASLANDNPEQFLREHKAPLIIDEVQYAPNLFRYLKIVIDKNRQKKGEYILTGSQKLPLMENVSESLSGRCAVIELETLSLSEIMAIYPDRKIMDCVIRGGFPEMNVEIERDVNIYFESYLATYLERDIRNILKVHNLRDFNRFIRACAYRSGQILNKTELARDVGISPTTANEWLTILEASNQIFILEPWFSNKTKGLAKSPKIYLTDTGLLCHFFNIRTQENLFQSPARGAIWESFVCSELRKHQQWIKGRAELWTFRMLQQCEVDFLIQKGGRFYLIEAKLNETIHKNDIDQLLEAENIIGQKNILDKILLTPTNEKSSFQAGTITAHPLSQLPQKLFE
ncbi:MAG: ATP-binding protein [Deltaproteobacteria bacterium]|nr:ATP-binding protein [Deltaproteobacteria bacterium]